MQHNNIIARARECVSVNDSIYNILGPIHSFILLTLSFTCVAIGVDMIAVIVSGKAYKELDYRRGLFRLFPSACSWDERGEDRAI